MRRKREPVETSGLFPSAYSMSIVEALAWSLEQAAGAGPPRESESGWSPAGMNAWWEKWNDAHRVLMDNGGPDLTTRLGGS